LAELCWEREWHRPSVHRTGKKDPPRDEKPNRLLETNVVNPNNPVVATASHNRPPVAINANPNHPVVATASHNHRPVAINVNPNHHVVATASHNRRPVAINANPNHLAVVTGINHRPAAINVNPNHHAVVTGINHQPVAINVNPNHHAVVTDSHNHRPAAINVNPNHPAVVKGINHQPVAINVNPNHHVVVIASNPLLRNAVTIASPRRLSADSHHPFNVATIATPRLGETVSVDRLRWVDRRSGKCRRPAVCTVDMTTARRMAQTWTDVDRAVSPTSRVKGHLTAPTVSRLLAVPARDGKYSGVS